MPKQQPNANFKTKDGDRIELSCEGDNKIGIVLDIYPQQTLCLSISDWERICTIIKTIT